MLIKAYDVGSSIDAATLSAKFGSPQIVKWDDPVIIQFHEKDVHIYQFGAIIFFDCTDKEAFKFVDEINKLLGTDLKIAHTDLLYMEIVQEAPIQIKNWEGEEYYFDKYEEKIYFNEKYFDSKFLRIISFALAQSVAIDKFDEFADTLEIEIDKTLKWTKTHKFLLAFAANKTFDKTIKILKMRYSIVSDLMILDIPSTAWENAIYDELYKILTNHFEIQRRYKSISSKLQYSLEITETLSDTFEGSRATFLELMVVILILWEVIWEFLKLKFF